MSDGPTSGAAPDSVVEHPPLVFEAGTVSSSLYGDVFKSRAGAFDEARAVFVDGCRLPERWTARERFVVLELGFGLGVNFLATLTAWLAGRADGARLFFVSIERNPVSRRDLAQALSVLGAPAGLAAELVRQWPQALPGMHRLHFADGSVCLQLCLGSIEQVLPTLRLSADAIFLDGFAPSRNPDAWQTEALKAVGRLAVRGAMLSTYSAAAAVRRDLQGAGFEVSLRPGHAGKRHRLEAVFAPRWRLPNAGSMAMPLASAGADRDVVIVGAGLAGCAIARALASRGWRVTLLEAASGPAPPGSGSAQLACAEHLHLSADDNPLARLTRAAWSLGRSDAWRGSPGALDPPPRIGMPPAPDAYGRRVLGRLLIAADGAQRDHHLELIRRLSLPSAFAAWCEPDRLGDLAGVALTGLAGALWLPGSAACDVIHRCDAQLRDVMRSQAFGWAPRFDCTIAALRRAGELWQLLDVEGRLLAQTPVVVLANAGQALRLSGLASTSLQALGGRTTCFEPRGALARLACMLGGDAYALPVGDGRILTGATHHELGFVDAFEPPIPDVRIAGHRDGDAAIADDRANLRKLSGLVGQTDLPMQIASPGGSFGIRFAARDHLPLIGAVPDESRVRADPAPWQRNDRLPIPRRPGLFMAAGFGGRGLLWSTLAAELLAAQIDAEPWPVESTLADRIDPARFLRKALRKG